MKLFLIKFFGFGFCFALAVLVLNYFACEKNATNALDNTTFSKNLVFLGNSKSECTFNDSLIANSLNLSQSGEALFYTYQKTQLLLRKKGAITTVFIQASPHELSEGWDKKIWNKKHLFEFLPRVVSVLSLEDFLPIVKNNPSELAKVFFVAAIMKNMHWCGFGNIICGRNFLGKSMAGQRY